MTQLILVDLPQGCNAELLRAELRAAVGEWVAGVSRTPAGWWVVVEDNAPADIEQQFDAVLAAHNPDALTPEQQAAADAATAPDRVRAIPGWALWSEDQAVDWIAANVTNLASAKVALTAMARMLVALRDAQWPTLRID